ncbi:hypothetical protein [Mycolicibacterium tusciae]|uniref:aa3-type cytochrome oxidase subunit CtaJ n=1 Tax=Mycolicibacterium tusciae TaxID=75922 RepID=UPI00024A19D7|nr:hypothetical protein [Mycolicibacterium tusciae]
MSTALTHSLLGGVPLAVLLVLVVLIYVVGPKRKDPHPETYKMSDQWTHEPILWAADEPADHGHGGHHPVTVGGGASGKW